VIGKCTRTDSGPTRKACADVERFFSPAGGGEVYYDDGHVHGWFEPAVRNGKRRLTIIEFESDERGKGHARKALVRLRRCFDKIDVVAIVGAADFWKKMRREHLVDKLAFERVEG
jgi:hypothetical protein